MYFGINLESVGLCYVLLHNIPGDLDIQAYALLLCEFFFLFRFRFAVN